MKKVSLAVEFLACPTCHSPLQPDGSSGVGCTGCGSSWSCDDRGIPVFAPDAASDPGFNQRWRKHPKPQPTPVSQFRDKTGWQPQDLTGQVFLDAGCGIGRYCQFAMECGAKTVIGVDISPQGLAGAYENIGSGHPNVQLIQADLLQIPIKAESVDRAISIGVLHHTASTKAAFMQVAKTVKPGGRLAVWVYVNPATDGTKQTAQAIDFFHEITRACPPEELYRIISKYATAIRDANHPTWGALQQVIRPSYNPDDEQCISDMFDWHTPKYRFWHTQDEVDSWFNEAGFTVEWRGTFPVSASGVKR